MQETHDRGWYHTHWRSGIMEIRESIQAFITDRNKAEGAWRPLIGTLLVSAMFAVWGLRPFSSLFQVGPNETLLCGLALFISILGVIFAGFFLRPLIDVTDVDGSQIVPVMLACTGSQTTKAYHCKPSSTLQMH